MPPTQTSFDKVWYEMYKRLLSYKRKHGNCLVPHKYKDDEKLGRWVIALRNKHKKNKVSKERINKLESIGFIFNKQEEEWNNHYNRLVSYKDKYGDCLVPFGYKKDKKLGSWVRSQRHCYTTNTLSDERTNRLKSIGFLFAIRKQQEEDNWNTRYEQLVMYKEKHGNCSVLRVPDKNKDNEQLGCWVHSQRTAYKKNKMSKDRIIKLKRIGFVFHVTENLWECMYKRLVSYKLKHGNCLVSPTYKDDKALGPWVAKQRTHYKDNKLSNYRLLKLKKIGFESYETYCKYRRRGTEPDDMNWNKLFNRLVSYKRKYGHCLVPSIYKQDMKLGNWVRTQRRAYKLNKLSTYRFKRLNSVGFVFTERNSVACSNNDGIDVKLSSADQLIKDAIQIKKDPKRISSDVIDKETLSAITKESHGCFKHIKKEASNRSNKKTDLNKKKNKNINGLIESKSGRKSFSSVRTRSQRRTTPISHNDDEIGKLTTSSIAIESRGQFNHLNKEANNRSNNKTCDDSGCIKQNDCISDDGNNNKNNRKKKKNVNDCREDPIQGNVTHTFDPNLVIVI